MDTSRADTPGPTLQTLTDRLRRHGDTEAVLAFRAGEEPQSVSFAALADRADAIAAGLASGGWRPGERVALIGENGVAWVAACLGLLRAGVVPVPLDPVMTDEDLSHALADSGARRVVVTRRRLAAVRRLSDRLDDPPALFLIDPAETLEEAGEGSDDPTPAALPSDRGADPPPAEREAGDAAVLFYTSGTTGAPKGVPLTHGNIVANLAELTREGVLPRDLRALMPLPLFHVYPFVVGLLTPLEIGAAVVFPAGLGGPELVSALREGRVSVLMGVPRLYEALLDAIGRRGGKRAERWLDLATWTARHLGHGPARLIAAPLRRRLGPDLRLAVSGGAALDAATAWRLTGLGLTVLTGYGLTETSPIVSFDPPDAPRPGAAGKPLESLELRIDEPDADGIGEIAVRGPNVFGGYLHLPDKTAEVLDSDGWFTTGDLGRLDANGYLHVGARRSEMITLGGGQNVSAGRIEGLLDGEPEIAESAVLAPEARLVALIRPERDALAGRDARSAVDQALDRIRGRLPGDARLSDTALVAAPLPRTPIGKLRRHELPGLWRQVVEEGREPAPELSAEEREILDDPAAAEVWDWLQRRFPDRPVAMGAELQAALGIDSLERITLGLELERELGIRLEAEAWSGMVTVRDLVERAAEAKGEAGGAPAEGGGMPGPDDLSPEQRRWARHPGPAGRAAAYLLLGLDRALFRTVWPVSVEGLEHVPARGPAILAPNHRSYLDPPALASVLPTGRLERLWWAGASGIMASSAPRRALSRAIRVLPVEEGRAPGVGIALAQAVLERGEAVVWFPEAGRAPPGRLMPFRPGIGVLAERCPEVPILPVAITGTDAAWGRDRTWPRGGRIAIRIGEPVMPAELAPEDADRRPRAVAEALETRVRALVGEEA